MVGFKRADDPGTRRERAVWGARAPLVVHVWMLVALPGCVEETAKPAAEVAPVAAGPPALTIIRLPILTVREPFRWDTEFRGFATTELELGLSDLAGVIAIVPGDAPPPTWARYHPRAEHTFEATFTADGPAEALTLTLTLCETPEPCITHTATGSREAPHAMFAALLDGVAEQLHVPPDEATRTAWSTPGSKDHYAELITGRGCATYLGLLPAPAEAGDKKANPALRAVFIDPGQPLAQWMWARWQIYGVAGAGTAVDTMRRAALSRSTSPLLMADLATSLTLTGKPAEAALVWQALTEQAPDDPRWMTPYADMLLRLGRPLEARAALARLPATFRLDPAYAELQVRIAEGIGKEDLDPLLAHWAETDRHSPEPVKRRIQKRVADGKYADALTLVPALRTRAPGPQTDSLEVALLTATGQVDAAADRAPAEVAARLRARSAQEADPSAEPVGLSDAVAALAAADARLWANKPGSSLDAADVALRLGASADAWCARARALEAAGRTEESVHAWQEAWQLDPSTDGGPVSPQRIASTFRMQPPVEPEPIDEELDVPGPRMGLEE